MESKGVIYGKISAILDIKSDLGWGQGCTLPTKYWGHCSQICANRMQVLLMAQLVDCVVCDLIRPHW